MASQVDRELPKDDFTWLFWVYVPGKKHPYHYECITEEGKTVVCNLMFSDNESKTREDAVCAIYEPKKLAGVGMSHAAACGALFRVVKFYGRCTKIVRIVPADELELTL